MRGPMRQRSEGFCELRVFVGRDPLTGRRQYVTKTFRGGKRRVDAELASVTEPTDRTVRWQPSGVARSGGRDRTASSSWP
jgi:hypothetical protein